VPGTSDPDRSPVNAAPFFVDAPLEEGHGWRTALVTPTGATSYEELRQLTDRAANALRALGVEPEQRVALLLPDGVGFVATFFAALKLGAIAVPLNTRLAETQYRLVLADCRAKVLVTDADLGFPRSALDGTAVRTVVTWGDLARGPATPVAPEAVGLDAMAFWLYTSGTTGLPKAAVHCHRDLLAWRPYGLDVLGMTPDDRVFATSKLFFAYPLGNGLMIALAVRASMVLHPAWPEPGIVRDVMRDSAPTVLLSVPTVFARLVRSELPRDTFRSLRFAVSAGERLPAELHTAWGDHFGVELLDAMGATETVFMVLGNRPGRSRPGASGQPVPGTDVKLCDADGREVADGEEGVLHVRTPSMSACYWNRLDQSRRTFVGEWFRTGDVYVRDGDGFYHHRGRADDFFKVAGLWVVPADVESVLASHPDVVEVGVVGAGDAAGLTKTFAFVVPRGHVAREDLVRDLTELAERKLPTHQRPRKVIVVDELPRTATGKLQRYRLRQLAEG
jgi:benzoate-CoA ligase family protein